jgi:hypothetical protein
MRDCTRLSASVYALANTVAPTWRRGNREERCDALSRIRPYTLFDLPLVALAHRLPPELNCKHLSLNGWFEHIRPVGKLRRAKHPHLTSEDFEWLRKIRAATDAKRDPPPVPKEVAGKLRRFGFVTPNGLTGSAITDRGRGALLEQDMRDAEDR